MAKQKTLEEVIEQFKAVHGDKYDYSLVNSAGSHDKVKIICPKHDYIFEQKVYAHLQGRGCIKCKYENQSNNIKSNLEEFIMKARAIHGDKYDYSKAVYTKAANKITIGCPKHGDFEQSIILHLNGSGCPKCSYEQRAKKSSKTQYQIIEEFKKVHGDTYDYSEVKYVNNSTKVKIICKKHGSFWQSPISHKKAGCPKCGNIRSIESSKLSTEEFIIRAVSIHEHRYDYSKVDYEGTQIPVEIICKEHGSFFQRPNDHLSGNGCRKCAAVGKSSQEKVIIDNIGISAISNDRTLLGGKEIDIYYPDYNVGIEVNGIYWHSDIAPNPKEEKYHQEKTIACESKGVHLLQFWDVEVNTKTDIVLSVIRSKLGIIDERIFARKCSIKEVDFTQAKEFLDTNHMQGGGSVGSIRYGLYYMDELISIMTFGKSRFNKNYMWELIRFCNKRNTIVIGAASKLFKHANLDSVISYANRRWSNGKLYEQLGFTYLHDSKPNYVYVKSGVTYNRQDMQKHKLSKILGDKFDPHKSAESNLKSAGYGKLYDCGNLVYGYKK